MTTCLRKARRGRDSSPLSLLIQYSRTLNNNITIQTNGNHRHFFIRIPIFGQVLVHSFDKIHFLVVKVELIWLLFLNIFPFNFVPTPNKFLRSTGLRSYVTHLVVVQINQCQNYTAFLLDVWCLKWQRSFFAAVFPNDKASAKPIFDEHTLLECY